MNMWRALTLPWLHWDAAVWLRKCIASCCMGPVRPSSPGTEGGMIKGPEWPPSGSRSTPSRISSTRSTSRPHGFVISFMSICIKQAKKLNLDKKNNCGIHRNISLLSLTPRCSPSLILSVCISLRVFLLKVCIMAFCAVRRVEAFRSCTATTDITGLQIRNWISAPTDTRPPSLVLTFWRKKFRNVKILGI